MVPFVKEQIKTSIKRNSLLHDKRKENRIQFQNMYCATVIFHKVPIKKNKLSDLNVVFYVKLRKKFENSSTNGTGYLVLHQLCNSFKVSRMTVNESFRLPKHWDQLIVASFI